MNIVLEMVEKKHNTDIRKTQTTIHQLSEEEEP